MAGVNWLWDTSGFPARWLCGEGWGSEPYLGWFHITADLVTWGAYIAIPFVLGYFVIRRKDLALPGVFWLFCGFIFSCGFVHLLEAVTFWLPVYRLSAILKIITALVSVATVLGLIRVLPKALSLPGLAAVNERLSQSQAELKVYADQLERSNNDLQQFAYVASHDLRAPLRGISQLASWVAEDEGDNLSEPGQEHLRLLRNRVHRMEGLLKDLLTFSSIGSGDAEPDEVHVGELLAEIADLYGAPDGYSIAWPDDLPTMRAYVAPLRMVFMNLIGNAIKHRGDAGREVRIEAQDLGDRWEFAFVDDGPGIALGYQERVFGMFQTLRRRDEVEGSGMGLAIVKRTLEEFGGTVSLESDGSSGTTFRITWPKSPVRVGVDQPNEPQPVAAGSSV